MNHKKHLPLYGVGPVIVAFQMIITAIGVVLSYEGYLPGIEIDCLDIPLKIFGIALIAFGCYLNDSAKRKSRIFEQVAENKLITTGVYGIVRNPVYSAVLLACTGAVCISSNLLLFVIPVICWAYMTIFLICTEEKWLMELYGQEYRAYCKKVNRCIPWFPKRES